MAASLSSCRRRIRHVLAAAAALLIGPGAGRAATVDPGYRLDRLVAPSQFHGIHGMKVGPDGGLYVCDIYGFTIWRVDVRTGAARAFVPFASGMCDDLAFGPGGLLAWTSPGKVFGRTPAGRIYEIASNLPGVNGIGFTRSGRLLVTQISKTLNTLVEVDPSGRAPPTVLLTLTAGINGFRIDKDDILWGPQGQRSRGAGNIVRIDLRTLKTSLVARGFNTPTGVDIDSTGQLYVVDLLEGSLTRVDPSNGGKTLVGQFDPWLDNLTISNDKIYLADTADNRILEAEPHTGAVRVIRPGGLALPGGLTVVPAPSGDMIYVADYFSYKKVDAGTGRVTDLGHRLGRPMASGTGIRWSQGRLLLTTVFGSLTVIDPATEAIVRSIDGLAAPVGAAMLDNGEIVVAESGAGRLTRIAADGARSVITDKLQSPVGLVVDPAGKTAFVTDAAAGVLYRVDLASGARHVVASGLRQPEGLDRAPDGALFLVEGRGGAIVRVDPGTGRRRTIARGLPIGINPPPQLEAVAAVEPTIMLPPRRFWIPNGLAVGPTGTIYVSADKIGALYQLTPSGRHVAQR